MFYYKENRNGFTLIEAVVMLGVITAISSVVLVSFTGLSEGGALNRSARDLALSLRQAQNMALAITQVSTSLGPKIPPATGIKLVQNSTSYFTFADLNLDNKYTGENEDAKIGSDQNFVRGIKVKSLTDDTGNARSIAYIIFAAPEAAVALSDVNGTKVGNQLTIELTSGSGNTTKKIIIGTSGQISIKWIILKGK